MSIVSIGYPGTIDAVEWASLAEELGAAYGVIGPDDWKVTVIVGPDRTVAVAPGTGFGRGIMDTNSAAVNLQHASVGSGVRYDMICAHRNWSTPATTFTIVEGTSSPVIPSARDASPGTVDDQPLALVKITSGSTVPVIEADLRTWPSKVVAVNDLRALVDPKLGDEAVLESTGVRYRRVLDSVGSPVWQVTGGLIATGAEGASKGATAPEGTPLTTVLRTWVGEPNGAGGVGIGFPAFPNGIVLYHATSGDGSITSARTLLGNSGLGAWNGQVFDSSGNPVGSGLVRVNLTVIGW